MSSESHLPGHVSQQVARGQKPQPEKRSAGVAVHQSGMQGDVAAEESKPTSHKGRTSHKAPTSVLPKGPS
jgi:hypothetical protein